MGKTGPKSDSEPVGDPAATQAVEEAAGTDYIRLGEDYRNQTKPQIVTVDGVEIPVYGVRNKQELAQITETLNNTSGVGPNVLAAVPQINLYDEGRFEAPAFFAGDNDQIYVNRNHQFPNLNHEFGHLVDDKVGAESYGAFGKGPNLNDYGGTNSNEDFAVYFDYLTAGKVEGLKPEVLQDPQAQDKLAATQEVLDRFNEFYPNGERADAGVVDGISNAAQAAGSGIRKVAGGVGSLLGF